MSRAPVGTLAAATAVVELEEIHALLAEAQERGYMSASGLAAAVEEAELDDRQLGEGLEHQHLLVGW